MPIVSTLRVASIPRVYLRDNLKVNTFESKNGKFGNWIYQHDILLTTSFTLINHLLFYILTTKTK